VGHQGYHAPVEDITKHAGNIDALRERFGAIKAASSHIAKDNEAYGLLCGWIADVLEGKHVKVDDVIAYVEENLQLVADTLRDAAKVYERMEEQHRGTFQAIESGVR